MKQAAVETKKENRSESLLARGVLQRPTINRVAEYAMPSRPTRNSMGASFNHDFSRVTARSRTCPLFPRRCPFGGACHTCPVRLQTKLKINEPGDNYEQEADRVAEQVMRMPEPAMFERGAMADAEEQTLQKESLPHQSYTDSVTVSKTQGIVASNAFRKYFDQIAVPASRSPGLLAMLRVNSAAKEYEQEAENIANRAMRTKETRPYQGHCEVKIQAEQQGNAIVTLQMMSVPQSEAAALEAPPMVDEVLRSPGKPLDAPSRAFMEPQFGYDFGRVRVHADSKAHASARALQARAYTVGCDIVFGEGQYAAHTAEGRRLLAHELAHVVQQSNGAPRYIQRLVEASRVSCNRYPRNYPIFTTIRTNDPVGVLQVADARALEMLNNVIGELTRIRNRVTAGDTPGWPLIADVIALGMRNRLRMNPEDPAVWTGAGPGTIEIIIRWYTNVRNLLASGAIRYTCLGAICGGDWWAYTLDGVPRRIHLCRSFWRASRDNQALTLIHEAAHLYYGLEDTGGGAGNASCLEQFVADANGIAILPAYINACRAPAP